MSAGMIAVPSIVPLKPPDKTSFGNRKWMISVNTPIEIHSNTPNSYLFYTLDGSKPDPFKKVGKRNTFQYEEIFTLPAGKQTIKAIAVYKDGLRESSVNTKVFQVDEVENNSADEELPNTTWKLQDIESPRLQSNSQLLFKKVNKQPNGVVKKKQDSLQHSNEMVCRVMTASPVEEIVYRPNESFENLSCLRCGQARPVDPYARFCNSCGLSLPLEPSVLRSSVGRILEKTKKCLKCQSHVPYDAKFCSMCSEEVVHGNNQSAEMFGSKKNICKNCGTSNFIVSDKCAVCEEKLNSKFDSPKPSVNFVICPACKRINSADARYCDWCGEKPQDENATVRCENCFSLNNIYSSNCFSCKKIISAPMRDSFDKGIKSGEIKLKNNNKKKDEFLSTLTEGDDPNWRKIPIEHSSIKKIKHCSTQAGDGVIAASVGNSNVQKLSAGKGYWRQQVEHITQQLKIYSTNNIEFRDSFSQYVLSGLEFAEVKSQKEKSTVFLTLEFGFKSDKKRKNKPVIRTLDDSSSQPISNFLALNSKFKINSRPGSASSKPSSRPGSAKSTPRSRSNSVQSHPNSARKTKVTVKSIEKEKIAAKLSKLSSESLKVLHLINSKKEMDQEQLENLINSTNFDPNSRDENDIPLLKNCVLNKKFDAIKLLIEANAKIDEISSAKETTALHEAVLLGVHGLPAVDVLLTYKASTQLKNRKGKSAYDLAIDSGNDMIISRFTHHTSQDLMKNIVKL